jgi:iron complex outermembrane recepter protein
MKKQFLTSILLLSALYAFAQSKITGKLLDEKKQALSFANLLLMKPDSSMFRGVLSDDNGQFVFEDVPFGKYYIQVQYVGYQNFMTTVQAFDKPEINLTDIEMRTATNQLNEVTITAKKPLLEMRGDKLVMNVEASAIASQGTALEALRRAPGVLVRQEKELALRGKAGVLVMIDDKITQMSQEDLLRYLQSIPATMIDRIEIINNPSARYDAAGTAGIINIKLKKDKNLGFNGTMTASAGYGRTPKGNLSSNLNYRNKKVNVFANLSADHWAQDNRQYFQRDFGTTNELTTFDQAFIQDQKEDNYNAKVGADCSIHQL